MKQFFFMLLLLVISNIPESVAQVIDYQSITPSELPVGTKVIPKNAFQNREDLVEVTIPEGVEIIEEHAFFNCFNLQKVVLPSTLISAKGAFYSCNNLKDVTCLSIVPPSLTAKATYSAVNLTYYTDYDALVDAVRRDIGYGTSSWFVYDKTDLNQKNLKLSNRSNKTILGDL